MIYDFENYRMLHKLRQKITLKIKKYEDLRFMTFLNISYSFWAI
jgi:hypothetical protein